MSRHRIRRMRRWASETLEDARAYFEFDRFGNEVVRRTDFERCARPVLLLYGFMATRSVFRPLEERLRRDGFGVFSVNLGGLFDAFNTRGIDECARRVHEKIEHLYARHHLGPLAIVGHSKGGLIGRYYLQLLGGERRACSLITLGTPHQGSPTAYAGIALMGLVSRSVWQMTPVSPLIRRLNAAPFPPAVRVVSIYSKADRASPFPACVLDTTAGPAIFNEEVAVPGHRHLLLRKRVYELVRRELLLGYRAVERPATSEAG